MGTEIQFTVTVDRDLTEPQAAELASAVRAATGAATATAQIVGGTPVEMSYETEDGTRTVLRWPDGREQQISGPPAPGYIPPDDPQAIAAEEAGQAATAALADEPDPGSDTA